MNCLVGCIQPRLMVDPNTVHKPIDKPGLLPWVDVWFSNNRNKRVGVSNWSSINSNAVINSFSFGSSNGNGAEIEIVDERGGSFHNFLLGISRGNIDSTKNKWNFNFQFGWATSDCNGNELTYGSEVCNPRLTMGGMTSSFRSCIHTQTIRRISADVNKSSMLKFKILASDVTIDMLTSKVFDTFGKDGSPLPLTVAIAKMFDSFGVDVKFLDSDGQSPMQFSNTCICATTVASTVGVAALGGPIAAALQGNLVGPCRVWTGQNRNPIQLARMWLNGCLTAKGRGVVSFWASGQTDRPLLIFMESFIPGDGSDRVQFPSVGTYVIGGSCSPVIEFTPKAEYVMESAFSGDNAQTSGTTGTAGSGLTNRSYRQSDPVLRGSATTRQQGFQAPAGALDDGWYDCYGLDADITLQRSLFINNRANLLKPGITAELKVQGDPSYDNPVLFRGRSITLVHLNPFTIQGLGNGCDFLDNGCSDFSSTTWSIEGVHHSITSGKFVTTFSLRLLAPGQEIGVNNELGDFPSAPTFPGAAFA